MTDVRYESDGANAKLTELEGLESLVQEGADQILRWAAQMKGGFEGALEELVKIFQFDLHNYRRTAFSNLEATTATHCR